MSNTVEPEHTPRTMELGQRCLDLCLEYRDCDLPKVLSALGTVIGTIAPDTEKATLLWLLDFGIDNSPERAKAAAE